MKASDDLFNLVRSLNKNEKRYFRLLSGLHAGEKKFLLLFDAVDSQKEYDEETIKKKFRKEKFIRQLTFTKNYLYKSILKSLESYHSSADSEIKNLLHRVEILFEKGLYAQCGKLLK